MTDYNEKVLKVRMPDRIRRLPISDQGYPVPKFVLYIDGKPDFRVMDSAHLVRCVKQHVCWTCGDRMGRHLAFPIGPMCAVNRTTAEPPSHLECARFACEACPFLTQPKMRRNEKGLPEEAQNPAGIMIKRNPGVTCIWVTGGYRTFASGNGRLFKIGAPTGVEWWAHGRKATREEVMASIDSGLPALREIAAKEGGEAMRAVEKALTIAMPLVPV